MLENIKNMNFELNANKERKKIDKLIKQDHRQIGVAMDLFSFPKSIGLGLPIFHPKGGIIKKLMEDYSRAKHQEAGYDFVCTPHIARDKLFNQSQHLELYKQSMFPAIRILDDNKLKNIKNYYLKPMNCPMHNLIYLSKPRFLEELPIRYFEFASVYRYEKSGVLHGLTRVRGMTQDDAHIYCTYDHIESELNKVLKFTLNLLNDFGLNNYYLEISTKNKSKFVGNENIWNKTTEILKNVAKSTNLQVCQDPGGAAFYGPKISVKIKDSFGRKWQISTIQLDFNLPKLFNLLYQNINKKMKRPIIIHRALFGSVERFLGILLEHYSGVLPFWLAPLQIIGLPVVNVYNTHIVKIINRLKKLGIRANYDISKNRLSKKILLASKSKIPLMIIIGKEDIKNNTISLRFHNGHQENMIPLEIVEKRILNFNKPGKLSL